MPRFALRQYRGDAAVIRHVAGCTWLVTGVLVPRGGGRWEAYPSHRVGGPVSQLFTSQQEAVEWLQSLEPERLR